MRHHDRHDNRSITVRAIWSRCGLCRDEPPRPGCPGLPGCYPAGQAGPRSTVGATSPPRARPGPPVYDWIPPPPGYPPGDVVSSGSSVSACRFAALHMQPSQICGCQPTARETLTQCRCNVGPVSQTLAQYYTDTVSSPRNTCEMTSHTRSFAPPLILHTDPVKYRTLPQYWISADLAISHWANIDPEQGRCYTIPDSRTLHFPGLATYICMRQRPVCHR